MEGRGQLWKIVLSPMGPKDPSQVGVLGGSDLYILSSLADRTVYFITTYY